VSRDSDDPTSNKRFFILAMREMLLVEAGVDSIEK
jgi:hypothetical protein